MVKKCKVCSRSVYSEEQQSGVDFPLHTTCFKCQMPGCSVHLNIATYKAANNKIYCPTHFNKLTASKGYVGSKQSQSNTTTVEENTSPTSGTKYTSKPTTTTTTRATTTRTRFILNIALQTISIVLGLMLIVVSILRMVGVAGYPYMWTDAFNIQNLILCIYLM